MPRKNRLESPTGIYYWINRGITKKAIFHKPPDYKFFRSLLSEYKPIYDVHIHHYCFMTNHVHLLVACPSLENLSKFSQLVQRRYAYYYSKTYHWSGSIFQGRYKSLAVDKDTYLLECGRYIERNPLKAGLAERPEDYEHSSYSLYGFGHTDDLVETSPTYLDLSNDTITRQVLYRDYVTQLRLQEMVSEGKMPF